MSRIAALAMAVSPGFVFYGRYAIHEVWLQFFSMMFILGLLGLWRRGTLTYFWYAGMGLTGMILTKETYAIHRRLRVACDSNSGSFLRAKSRSGREACKANLELDRSRHGRDRRRICYHLFLLGNFL